MDLPGTYLELLPWDLRMEIEIYNVPYPEILKLCGDFCDNKRFWIIKAAMVVGENPDDLEFLRFLDQYGVIGKHGYIKLYILVLALDGKAVRGVLSISEGNQYTFISIGSEKLLHPCNMLKYAIKNNDEKLLDYTMKLLLYDPNFYRGQNLIIEALLKGMRINNLILYLNKLPEKFLTILHPINYAKLRFLGIPEKKILILQSAYNRVLIDKKEHQHYIQENEKDYKVMMGIMPADPKSEQLKTAIIYGQDKIIKSLTEKFAPKGKNKTIQGYIVTKNLKNLGNFTFSYDDLNFQELAETDSPEVFDLVCKNLELQYFVRVDLIMETLEYAEYNSKLFEHLLNLIKNIDNINVRGLIVRKSFTDFAGLATIYQQASPYIRTQLELSSNLGYSPAVNAIFKHII